jgi:hypothetical protein
MFGVKRNLTLAPKKIAPYEAPLDTDSRRRGLLDLCTEKKVASPVTM